MESKGTGRLLSGVLVMVFLMLSVAAWAEDREDRPYGILGDPLPPGVEMERGEFGGIDSEALTLVVDDISYALLPEALYLTSGLSRTKISYFTEGMAVGLYRLNSTVYELWEVASPEGADGNGKKDTSGRGQVRFEDGVWKN